MPLDPVCGKSIEPETAHVAIAFRGSLYYACCPLCAMAFEREPGRYVGSGATRQRAQVRTTAEHPSAPLVYTVMVTSGTAK